MIRILTLMNARLYDPIVGRVLSPDNYVQDNTSTQGFNRYSYALNNPLVYTDPTGNDVFDIIFMPFRFINEGANWISQRLSGNSGYGYDWNYIGTGQLPNDWRNNPNVVTGPNGFPIGPGGERTAFGDYGYNVDEQQGDRRGSLSAAYSNWGDYEKALAQGIDVPIYGTSWAAVGSSRLYYKGRYIKGFATIQAKGGTRQLTGSAPGLPLGVVESQFMSGGITLPGIGIFVSPGDKPLVQHELGHYLQFLQSGSNYADFYLRIGIPSLVNAAESQFARGLGLDPRALGIDHSTFSTETDANRLIFGPGGNPELGYPGTTVSPSLPWYSRANLYYNILRYGR